MMKILLILLIVVATFLAMEAIAWLTHKYVMHGFLWSLHKDHHTGSKGFFEKNDFFFLIFAIPGFLLVLTGVTQHLPYITAAGAGITLYGAAYFLVHDIFIHQRFKLFRNVKHPYLLALRRAHKMHHKHLGPSPGESFGMLIISRRYFRQIKSRQHLHG